MIALKYVMLIAFMLFMSVIAFAKKGDDKSQH